MHRMSETYDLIDVNAANIENASCSCLQIASELGLPARTVEFTTAREVQEAAPSAYGVFGLVYNGRLLSYTYLDRAAFEKRLAQIGE